MKNDKKPEISLLRQKAEEELIGKSLNLDLKYLSSDIQLIIHELQVHQIELQMQNEELVRAKERAEDASEKYRDLYDFAPSGYFTLSREGGILELNLAASQMLGKERGNLKNSRLGFFVSDETRADFNDFLDRLFKSKTREGCEVLFEGFENGPVVVQLQGIVSGNGESCLLTAVDITKRKGDEIALRDSRELYVDLVASQIAGIYRIYIHKRENGKSIMEISSLEFASNRFRALFELNDYENQDDLLSEIFKKIHPDFIEGFVRSLEDAVCALKPYKYEMKLVMPSGIKWVRFEANPHLLEDGSSRWTGIVIDITEQKLAEEAVRSSEEKYRMLLELASDAFFHGSEKGDFIMVNSAAIELTGYSREELFNMNMTDIFSAASLKENPPKYEQLKRGETVYSERDLVRKEGTVLQIEMSSLMMPDHTYQAFIRDITERKRIERALKQKLNEMEIYYELAITRERKMIALKSEINMLLGRLGEGPKY